MKPAVAAFTLLIFTLLACSLAGAKNVTAPPPSQARSEFSSDKGNSTTTKGSSTTTKGSSTTTKGSSTTTKGNSTTTKGSSTTTKGSSTTTKGSSSSSVLKGTPDLAGLAGEWHGVAYLTTSTDANSKDCIIFNVEAKGKSLWTDWSKTSLFGSEYTCDYKRIGGPTSVAGFQKLAPMSVACASGGWWRVAMNYAEAYVVSPYGVQNIRATTLVSCAFMRRTGNTLAWAEARWSNVTDCARYKAPTSAFIRRATFTLASNSSTAKTKPFTAQQSLCQAWLPKKTG